MSHLNKRDRMRILELSAEIAAEASRNPNVVFMIEFQEMLIEATYRKMVALLEADLDARGTDAPDGSEDHEDRDDDSNEAEAPGRMAPTSTSVWSREAREQAVAAAAPSPAAAPAKRSRARKPARD